MPLKIFLLYLICSTDGYATSFRQVTLANLIDNSDHIIVAKIIKIDTRNIEAINPYTRLKQKKDQIRLHIKIIEIIQSKQSNNINDILVVGLSVYRNTSVEVMKELHLGSTRIFFLKGHKFQYTFPAYFMKSIAEKKNVMIYLNERMFSACIILGC